MGGTRWHLGDCQSTVAGNAGLSPLQGSCMYCMKWKRRIESIKDGKQDHSAYEVTGFFPVSIRLLSKRFSVLLFNCHIQCWISPAQAWHVTLLSIDSLLPPLRYLLSHIRPPPLKIRLHQLLCPLHTRPRLQQFQLPQKPIVFD